MKRIREIRPLPEQPLKVIDEGVKRILQGLPKPPLGISDYMMLYSEIDNIHSSFQPQLFDYYKKVIDEYLTNTVMPCLREKKHNDELMLSELGRRWLNHKVMLKCLYRVFMTLDVYHTCRQRLPTLKDTGIILFRDLVYNDVRDKAKDAVIALINVEREGGQIDRELLRNAVNIFVEIGMGAMEHYENDFEYYMLEETAAYYSRKASTWILEDSCPEYMLKSEECLKEEKDRVSHYLHSSSEQKLLEKVQHELLAIHENQLLEKENSGCRALLRDGKAGDLFRMYRLYQKVPNGLEPIVAMFKQHIIDEQESLAKEAGDAANYKADGSDEQVSVLKVTQLHDKCMAYLTYCFANHPMFSKSMKEAFDLLIEKAGAVSTITAPSGCTSENIIDESISDLLEKDVRLLANASLC